jgi:hypothetical protein
VGLTTPHRKKQACYEKDHEPQTWTDSLDKRPKQRNMELWTGLVWLRIGTGGQAFVNSVMNLRVPLNAGNLPSGCTTCGLSSGTQLHTVK